MYLRYAKVRDVRDPERAHPTDAGIDFFVPKDFNNGCGYGIYPNQSVLIPSGIKVEIPYGYMGLFLNKSRIASCCGLLIGAQVIDTFYSGEVHINLHNVSENIYIIAPDDKVAQMVITPIASCGIMQVGEEELYNDFRPCDLRGEGGFGSTENKQEKII